MKEVEKGLYKTFGGEQAMISMILSERVMTVKVSKPDHVIISAKFCCVDGGREVVVEGQQVVVVRAVIVNIK